MNPNDSPEPVTLAAALRRAAEDLARTPAPVWTAPRPAGSKPAHPQAGGWRWAAAACAVALGVSVLLMVQPPPAPLAEAVASDFVPLVPRERWPDGVDAAWIVRTELPAERLATLGLPYDPAHAALPVRAELLLRPNGEALAVRVLHANR